MSTAITRDVANAGFARVETHIYATCQILACSQIIPYKTVKTKNITS